MTDERLYLTSSYGYQLPEGLIAQSPAVPRDSSRLLILSRRDGTMEHRRFSDLTEYLHPGDLLVRNDTRVMAARLMGTKIGGGAKVELLLLSRLSDRTWEALVRPGRRLQPGVPVELEDGTTVTIEANRSEGLREVAFPDGLNVDKLMDRLGVVPLPPYITNTSSPAESYQTVFSRNPRSAAAPTAGLHFTSELLDKVARMGVEIVDVTLHVGLGTFRPVQEDDIRAHHMHRERCFISSKTAEAVNRARREGRRVVAVGTTSVRTLESMVENGEVVSGSRETSLYIYPGFRFQAVDAMITNFHLPHSSLLMLVSAFAGLDMVQNAYREAVRREYRFFSFGDAMLIT
ncbi:MAG: tRNA preQ1(34) S-adenosylmethionine ribosyltransferase-isomerase QueA [Dethiosulfovibrio peptidovorans]|nr:MAG: tRNA preQ1(34) S-adenosylmethionine ribosyltransferase-isomerase QueA [Dethiosulfovibrio peptidovorans]